MILDAIIAIFVSLYGLLLGALGLVFIPIANLVAAFIELIVGIFVSGFELGRMKKREQSRGSTIASVLSLLVILGVVGWLFVIPRVMNRKVTLVADDGHSLPFAALVIHTDGGDHHKRTDNAGKISIPRFATKAVTIKDPRYVENTWQRSEIGPELVVGRTLLGSSLDSLADRILKSAKKKGD